MSILDLLRKGFGYVLMSMGVSSPDAARKKAAAGAIPKPGGRVVLSKLPPGFLDDLPIEDREAISDVVGKPVLLNEYDEDGRAELEFADQHGITHFVHVRPEFLKPLS